MTSHGRSDQSTKARAEPHRGARNAWSRFRLLAESRGVDVRPLVPLGVLGIIVVGIEISEPTYLNITSVQATLVAAAPILLLAMGSAMVVIMGGLDLSIGGMVALASVLCAKAFPTIGPVAGLVVVVAIAALLGGAQGWVGAKAQVPSFIVTLGGLGVFGGLALRISHGADITVDKGSGFLDWLASMTLGFPNTFLVAAACFAILGSLMRWTPLGRVMFAIGSAEPAARIAGVNVTRTRVVVFAISGMMAALAATCLMSASGSGGPSFGDGLLLPTIAAVVVGGIAISGGVGGVGRAAIGALIVTALTTGTATIGANPGLQQILFGIATIAATALTVDRRRIGTIK